MTEEKSPEPTHEAADNDSNSSAAVASQASPSDTQFASADQPEPPPTPEPMTPERMAAENRRNDAFIMIAALVVAFLLGCFKITDSSIWIHLKAGWQIDQEGVPTRDSFSYTTGDKGWVNLNWLYDWVLYRAELIESRLRVRRLVADFRKLLANSQVPKLDREGREVGSPLAEERQQQIEQAISNLERAAETTDTYQMRIAAERTAETFEAAGLQLPLPSQEADRGGTFPALIRYTSPGGKALITMVGPIFAKGFVLAALAGVLLLVRHPGPTRWWAAVVAIMVLVAIGDHLALAPHILSLLFIAVVFWILHEFQSGRTWPVWLLVPLEMLWVNVDSCFPWGIGLAIAVWAGHVLGQVWGRTDWQGPGGRSKALAAAIVLSVVATMVNPFGARAWTVPLNWTAEVIGRMPYVAASLAAAFGSEAEWVGPAFQRGSELVTLAPDMTTPLSGRHAALLMQLPIPHVTTVLLLLLAFGSFVLNRQRFRATRLIVLLVCVGSFFLASRYQAIAVLAAGVMLSLNGQEWFLDQFGAETRLTRGWLVWSQGGRAVTILAIVCVAIAGITGWLGVAGGDAAGGEFGRDFQWVKFDLEAARFLRQAKLTGNTLNAVPIQGNLLIWSNYPAAKAFLDSRVDLHRDQLADLDTLRRAMRDGEVDTWRPILDKYKISSVMLNLSPFADHMTFLRTYRRMAEDSKNWRLVHRDSCNAIFGRVGVSDDHPLAQDARWFEEHAFEAAELVYRADSPSLPDPPAPVAPPTLIDRIWRTRRIPSSRARAARYYLLPQLAVSESSDAIGSVRVPTENCYLAIRLIRHGLAEQDRVSPDNYEWLFRAYFYLFNTEMSIVPSVEINDLRQLQLMGALNQFVAANPRNIEAQLQLAFRYYRMRYLDLADRHFDSAINLIPKDATIENLELDAGQLAKVSQSDLIGFSEQLKIELDRVNYDLQQFSSQMPSPMAQADFLIRRGCPQMAIDRLLEASTFAASGIDVSSMLARLYLRIGQAGDPENGAERWLINMQATGGLRPGVRKELLATAKLMQGDYERARTLMEDAIAETRHNLAQEALQGFTLSFRGAGIVDLAIDAPFQAVDDADRQAMLEFKLGMVQLEAGEPNEAARHFRQALLVREELPFRPVIAFYLEKITGEKLPELPPSTDQTPPGAPAETGRAADSSPEDSQPAQPAVVPPKPE